MNGNRDQKYYGEDLQAATVACGRIDHASNLLPEISCRNSQADCRVIIARYKCSVPFTSNVMIAAGAGGS